MKFLVITQWNGQEHAHLTDAPPAKAHCVQLAVETERYDAGDYTLRDAMQAREFGMLVEYAPPIRKVPWQAARFGLGENATLAGAQAAYERPAPTVDARIRRLMEIALRRWGE